ncbi:M15 family metallopeptidase [Methylibium sp.]|uniref:M15 family metallopeptidase n=1 Tax=Methylibium sp. TaxID=2067992 RepID=UPI003D0BBEED
MQLNARSEDRLKGVNVDIVSVVRRAAEITTVDFVVTEGLRTRERQAELFAARATRTMNSKHIVGRAVDLAAVVGSEVRWDWPLYHHLASAMKLAAGELGIRIAWGGDWVSFKDGPHFELA